MDVKKICVALGSVVAGITIGVIASVLKKRNRRISGK